MGNIALRVAEVAGDLLGRDRLDDPSRDPHRDHAVRNDHPLRHQRTGSDDAVFADDTVIQQGGVHSDQRTVAHRAAVDDGTVPHGDVSANVYPAAHITVQHGVVLHIAALAHRQGSVVAPQDRAVPDRRAGLEHHVADQGRIGRNKSCALIPGHFSTKGYDHCEKPPFSFRAFMVFF